MIEITPPVDRAILVGAPRRGTHDAVHAEEHLDELARLTDTAGAIVVGRLIQRIQAPDPHSYIGAGKLSELTQLVGSSEASLVIFDDELSPAQGKSLESALGVRVMDRAELILDIFAIRAKSKEAKLEVELAQLEYLLPRLARMWVHLSRIRGGIGLRGPGETQLETDRRMIRRRISRLKQNLAKVAVHRGVLRGGRRPIPTAALVGYTNAGKSSLLTALTGAKTFVEDRLFATLDTKTREMSLGAKQRIRLVDTVGFIRKLPHHLVASFEATLEEAATADIVLHVIDAARADWQEQVAVVDEALDGLNLDGRPVVHVFNKMDLVADAEALSDSAGPAYEHSARASAANNEVADVVAVLKSLVPVTGTVDSSGERLW
jgi:GTP-binding protein HflX